MTNYIAAELFKLRTTRTFVAICLSVMIILGLITGLTSALVDFEPGEQPIEDLLEVSFFVWPFAFVVGALAASTEFRHGTITPTLLAVPNRLSLLAAKLVAHLAAGFLLGVVAYLFPTLLMMLIFGIRDVETGLTTDEFLDIVLGSAIVAGLYAGIGVGIGAIVRNQVGALMGGLAWLTLLESLVAEIPGMDFLRTYGLQSLASATSGIDLGFEDDDLLSAVPAGLLLALYAVVFIAAGAAMLRRRDIESKT